MSSGLVKKPYQPLPRSTARRAAGLLMPPITPELVKQYAELGVHRLVALAPAGFAGPRDVDSMLRFVDEQAAIARRA